MTSNKYSIYIFEFIYALIITKQNELRNINNFHREFSNYDK